MLRSLIAAAFLIVPSVSMAADFTLDSGHSTVGFKVRHLGVSYTKGEFQKVTSALSYDAKNPSASKLEATIDVSSVNTKDEKRDGHLKSPDFFDVAKFPTMTFKSKKFEEANGKLKITGDLTLHGVTKEVVLEGDAFSAEVSDPYKNIKIGTSASTKINRKDFGVTWNATLDKGGLAVGEEVMISLDIEYNKVQAAPAPAPAPEAKPAAAPAKAVAAPVKPAGKK